MLKLLCISFTHFLYSQVGVGNTDPKASLDITASSVSNPTNADGILIPRVDDFPSTNPGADQDGMMVFATGNGTPVKGFYYWNNSISAWVIIGNNDSDWYEVGSTNAPNAISDNIYTTGNVSIGSNSGLNAALNIENVDNALLHGQFINRLSNSNDPSIRSGIYSFNNVQGSSPDYGVFSAISGNGTGNKVSFRALNSSSNSTGSSQFLFQGLFQNNSGTYDLLGSDIVFSSTTITNSGNKYGYRSIIPNTVPGVHYGFYSSVLNTSTGYAGYFLGRLSIGTSTGNNYILPLSRGTDGQIMQSDGLGNVSWATPNIGESTTSSNGLSQVVNDIQIGGNLTQNTTITNGNFDFTYNLNSTGEFVVQDNGSTAFIVENSGNIGIGTNSPSFPLDLQASGNTTINAFNLSKSDNTNTETNGLRLTKTSNGSGSSTGIRMTMDGTGSGARTAFSNSFSGGNSNIGAYVWFFNDFASNGDSDRIGFQNGFMDLGNGDHYGMRNVDSGIGNGTHYGTFNNLSGSGSGNKYGSYNLISSIANGTHYVTYNEVSSTNGWAGYFLGRNYISERLIIGELDNTNAALNISGNSSGTLHHIELEEVGANDGARIRYTNSAETTNSWLLFGRADNTSADSRFNINHSGTGNIIHIRGDGRVGINNNNPAYALELPNNATITVGQARANAWVTYSDSRIKKNQKALDYGLEAILKMQPKRYQQFNSTFKNNSLILLDSHSSQIGFIAQELYKITPEVVLKPKNESESLWSVNYEKLIPIAVQAIKEIHFKLEALEKENQKLENKLKQLEQLELRLSTLEHKLHSTYN